MSKEFYQGFITKKEKKMQELLESLKSLSADELRNVVREAVELLPEEVPPPPPEEPKPAVSDQDDELIRDEFGDIFDTTQEYGELKTQMLVNLHYYLSWHLDENNDPKVEIDVHDVDPITTENALGFHKVPDIDMPKDLLDIKKNKLDLISKFLEKCKEIALKNDVPYAQVVEHFYFSY